jgi:ribonuclease VapC
MVIDSSALIAILLGEPEADQMIEALQSEPKRLLSAANLLETSIVIEARKGPAGGRELSILLHRAKIEIVTMTEELSEIALEAWRRWGKGRHPAGLNYCDCCAYALAFHMGEKLLSQNRHWHRGSASARKSSQVACGEMFPPFPNLA